MLPIYQVQSQIIDPLRSGNRLVLTAPTGSGKTTQVPQILLRAALFPGQIIVLQPRRLATRLVARRVASEMNTPLGQLVGYQTRHDSQISPNTLIRFLTEGLFLRLLQSQPSLPGVGAVILDEFHERSLAADTALALTRRLQESSRPDLRLIVMSATLDAAAVSAYLSCPTVAAHGRLFPVTTHYLDKPSTAAPWDLAADALSHVLEQSDEGDVLVFMPGAYEIRRTIETCRRTVNTNQPINYFPLHGELPVHEQDAALSSSSTRKVIVSTNVAETSITVEGVRHVIDSGLARVNRFDPRRGINVLLIEPISRSSAEQRAGRAGRLAPGTCTRLWTQAQQRQRPDHELPEIKRLDLADAVLQLKAMGVATLTDFAWLEPPNPMALQQAQRILESLEAIDSTGRLTPAGRTMSQLPMHPRLSRMMVEASSRACLHRAALWAAMISDREILIRGAKHSFADDLGEGPASDFLVLERAYEAAKSARFDPDRCRGLGVHAAACRELEKTHQLFLETAADAGLLKTSPKSHSQSPVESVIKCLLAGFPDHLAKRRGENNLACALSGQRRGDLDKESIARKAPLIVAVEIREVGKSTKDRQVQTILSMASAVDPAWLEEVHPGRTHDQTQTTWDSDKRAAVRVHRLSFDDLVIEESLSGEPDPAEAARIIADLVVKGDLKLEKWDESVEQWIARTRCVADWFPERKLLRYEPDDLRVIIQEICTGAVRWSQVADRACLPAVRDALSWDDQQFVEQMAPDHLPLPGASKGPGSRNARLRISYTPGSPPRGRARIQELYGLTKSPLIAAGRQKLVLEILGPNHRPVQMTDDLAGFWTNLYPQLKKELSRKYPRHEWR